MQNQSTWPPSFQTIHQQLYAFAQQLKWAFPDELPEVEIWPVTYIPLLDHLLQTLQILFLNVWKERESDRGLHRQTQQVMVPYFFVTDRQTSGRWTPFYTTDVLNLPYEVRSPFEAE